MADIEGTVLTAADNKFLLQPEIAGLILFSRNYENPTQLKALCESIKALRSDLIIAVDQEGGRVQRFKDGFLRLPAMRRLGESYAEDAQVALKQSFSLAWLMAAELIRCGVDISFAPVLDLDFGRSSVIGDRAFAKDPMAVLALTEAFIEGMNAAGMSATAKHFPGHGYVTADSHLELPTDTRTFEQLEQHDLIPFRHLISKNQLAAIMPAHVVYPDVDSHCTAGFSKEWLQEILRKKMGFQGLIYSDDLSMEGAAASGRPSVRAIKAKEAGCNVLLICNHREAAQEIVDTVRDNRWPLIGLQTMQAKPFGEELVMSRFDDLYESRQWKAHLSICSALF